ncbi:Cof-type HAD-IIB family hydrolase [Buchnera aphidicola]|uniref:Cof-type HAD-IIB family hydrolase n=1 Tax=Buchnera aphidicola TaxID=9 RepID=UPI003BEEBFEC
MYKIIALDLDGTLLSPKYEITNYTEKIIKSLIEKNFYFIFASGRHYIDITSIQDKLKIKTFIISSNGARVYDLNRKLIFKKNLEIHIAQNLCKIKYFDNEIITQVYCDDNWYINNNEIDNKFCPSLSSLKYRFFKPNSLNYSNISKIFFTSCNINKMNILEEEIIHLWGDNINASYSMPGCLEIVSGKTSKGEGLKKISSLLGVSLKNFISFGDGMNDKEMLSISGKGCIMKNGDPRLKMILPNIEIIESNVNDGVALFLYNTFLKNNSI